MVEKLDLIVLVKDKDLKMEDRVDKEDLVEVIGGREDSVETEEDHETKVTQQ